MSSLNELPQNHGKPHASGSTLPNATETLLSLSSTENRNHPANPKLNHEAPSNMRRASILSLGKQQTLQPSEPMSASHPDTSTTAAEILLNALTLPLFPRFEYLLTHVNNLICLHGSYTTQKCESTGTIKFIPRPPKRKNNESPKPPSNKTHPSKPSLKSFALSLAAAQDASTSKPTKQPPNEPTDLEIFTLLWKTTATIFTHLLHTTKEATPKLPTEILAWGIHGLAAGYTPRIPRAFSSTIHSSPTHSHSPSSNIKTTRPRTTPPTLNALKSRLYEALVSLPFLRARARNEVGVEGGEGRLEEVLAGRMARLDRARREVHLCARLLVEGFMGEGWGGVRWGHGVKVVERWVAYLGLGEGNGDGDGGLRRLVVDL